MTPRARALDLPVLAAARAASGGVFACVNLHNFKAMNVVLGHAAGDRFLAEVQAALAAMALGCWRTGGDEFVALVRAELPEATEKLRAFCGAFHRRIEATQAWRVASDDPRCDGLVPWAIVEAVTTPRCGLASLGSDPDAALAAARAGCEAHALAAFEADHRTLETGPWAGFPPLTRGFSSRRIFAERCCPRCAACPPERLDEELGRAHERCPRCGLSFSRIDALIVDGVVHEGGYA
jgi:GGDEF domain-containing protein